MIRIALVQIDNKWQDVGYNLNLVESLIEDVNADVVLLPEMFATGFQTKDVIKSTRQDEILTFLKELAISKSMAISFSLAYTRDDDLMCNRLVWLMPNGSMEYYDKRHLFGLGAENKHFSRGKERLQLEFRDVQFCPLICYDLRFPVWSRNTQSYDVLIYLANWPEARIRAWKSLLVARAIENQCYVIGVNRCGSDGQGLKYNGQSVFIGPSGKVLHNSGDQSNCVSVVEVDMEVLQSFRRRFPFLNDADKFNIIVE